MIKRFLVWCMMCLPLPALAAIEVQEVTVGGYTIWLSEDHHLPIIELRMLFDDAGYASDPADAQGRAMLAADLLTEGAGEKDSSAFQRALEDKAISLSTSAGQDHLSVSLKTLSEHREAAFALMADALLRPRFDDASLQEAKKRFTIRRLRQQESPYYLAEKAFKTQAYAGHPYAQEALGSEQSIAALTRADLQNYMQQRVTKENVIISVAGGITPMQLKRLMVKYLKALPEAGDAPKLEVTTYPNEPFNLQVQKQLPQTVWKFVRSGIQRDDARFYAAYLLNYIVGGGSSLTSRLGEEVRKKRSLSYGIGTGLEQKNYANRWAGTVATQNATADEAKEVILQVFKQVSEEGVSAEELRAAKNYIQGSFPLNVASNSGVVSYLNSMQIYGLGKDYFAKRHALFEAVTLEQVNALAAEFLQPESWSWVRVGAAPEKE